MLTQYEKSAQSAISDHQMLNGASSLLVALSGGADSASLLHWLLSLTLSIPVHAAHLNHMLRGSEADRDENFVRDMCGRSGIPLHTRRVDVAAYARQHKLGTEEAARDVRYSFFAEVCAAEGISHVALAHTASDNAETVLFNLIRGTGASGLCGIPPVRDNLIRPLIYCTRADVIEYCIKNSIEYIIDSTNLQSDYSRNFIRNKINPLIAALNPSFENSITRTASLLRADKTFIEREVSSLAERYSINDSVPVEILLSLDTAISSRIITRIYESVADETMSFDAVMRVLELARSGKTGKKVTVGGGWVFANEYGILRVQKETRGNIPYDFQLKAGEEYEIQAKIRVKTAVNDSVPVNSEIVYNLFNYIEIDYDKIIGIVSVRNRAGGDYIVLDGHRRTLKKFLIDQKIPDTLRKIYPVIYDQAGIICICGMRPCDRVKPDKNTKRLYKVYYHGITSNKNKGNGNADL